MTPTVLPDTWESEAIGSSNPIHGSGCILLGVGAGLWGFPGQHLVAAAAALGAVLLLSVASHMRADDRLLYALQQYVQREAAQQT